ncbi:NAD-dependent epimerase/dehydratase [Helicobacter fennelliae]|uniref:NAD-dependent epimerase/dehydratase n=1 Tax=Helicobacter fennelliae TaxID=215 RepID=A0A2X3B2I6_9HELI|nr:NAD-dependent epimerase/dehydratase [Helicobacter fennelliae]
MQIYSNKKVFITGHTGFKGSWLSLYLHALGAKIYGYALKPHTTPNHFDLLESEKFITKSYYADINDYQSLECAIESSNPDIIFHLAAQPLVRRAYREPLYTLSTNAIGSANLLNAARKSPNLKAIVMITTDKVYENKEWLYPYRENDTLGGYDPYSASKACAEIIIDSMRASFFNITDFGKSHNVLIASARAGNVIGGGDWSEDRLIPDLIRGYINHSPTLIRYPDATRPWQHVLEPLRGYLLLGAKLLHRRKEYATSFNFGPENEGNINVSEVLHRAKTLWNQLSFHIQKDPNAPHEANFLMLDSTKARKMLHFTPIWNSLDSIKHTITWYKSLYESHTLLSHAQLEEYIKASKVSNGGGGTQHNKTHNLAQTPYNLFILFAPPTKTFTNSTIFTDFAHTFTLDSTILDSSFSANQNLTIYLNSYINSLTLKNHIHIHTYNNPNNNPNCATSSQNLCLLFAHNDSINTPECIPKYQNLKSIA